MVAALILWSKNENLLKEELAVSAQPVAVAGIEPAIKNIFLFFQRLETIKL
jgi:hypothetical protein